MARATLVVCVVGCMVGLASCGSPPDGGRPSVSVADTVVLVVDGTPVHRLEQRPDGCMAVVNRSTNEQLDDVCVDESELVLRSPVTEMLYRVQGDRIVVVKLLGDGYEFLGVRPGDALDGVEVEREGRWVLVEESVNGARRTTLIVEKDGIKLSCLLQSIHADCGGFQP